MNYHKVLDFVAQYDSRGLSEFNRKKAETLYWFARLAPAGGVIIELGVYHGIGTVPLWYGAQDGNGGKVICVDAYADMRGWIGEPYGPQDETIWHANMQAAGISPQLVKADALALAEVWTHPFALLVHDLGSKVRMPNDVMAWERHAITGATIAMRDIDDFSMGTEEAVNRLLATHRWGGRENWPAFYTSLERLP